MLSQSNVRDLINEEKAEQLAESIEVAGSEMVIPVFAKQLPGSIAQDPLFAYIELVQTKPDGYWLMRESRREGMISITFKLDGAVGHDRFVFKDQQWQEVNNPQKITALGAYVPQNKDTVNHTIIESLLDAIYATRPLEYEKLIIPSEAYSSRNMAYIQACPYVLATQRDGKEQKIYADLLGSLAKITDLINENIRILADEESRLTPLTLDMKSLQAVVLPSRSKLNTDLCLKRTFLLENSARFLKDLFAQWLEDNQLDDELSCPVGRTLFVEPYYIFESGHVFDASSLFPKGKCLLTCPLTREPIVLHPVHFDGYRRKLSECLIRFFDFIELYQAKLVHTQKSENDSTNNKEVAIEENKTVVANASGHLFFAGVREDVDTENEPPCSVMSLGSLS